MTDQHKQHGEIMHELGVISGTLEGIDKHLEKLNGSVASNTKRLNKLDVSRAKEKGIIIGISSVVSVVWGFLIRNFF